MNTTVSTNVTAGLGGFLAFFVLAVALWLLMRNMNARLRRMSFREEAEAQAAQDRAAGGTPAPRAEDSRDAGDSVEDDADRDQDPGAAGEGRA